MKTAFAIVLLVLTTLNANAAFRFAGNVESVTVATNGADFRLASGEQARVEIFRPGIARVRFAPSGTFTEKKTGAITAGAFTPPAVTVYDYTSVTYIVSDDIYAIILKNPLQIILIRNDGTLLSADQSAGIGWDTSTGLVLVRKYAPASEHYFGLGERGGPVDRRSRSFYLLNVDNAGYTQLDDPLYSSHSFFYTLANGKAHGVYLDNAAAPFFDFAATDSGTLTFGAMSGELDYYVMSGPQTIKVSQAFTTLTGKAPPPPLWSLGYLQSRYSYRSSSELETIAAKLRELKIPCDALFLDIDYMDRYGYLSWNQQTFPDPLAMNARLTDKGFRVVNILEPLLLRTDPLWPYFSGMEYLVGDRNRVPLVNEIFLGQVSWIDFTKLPAREFVKTQLKTFLATGISGIWNDLNEPAQNYMPEAIYSFDGENRTDLEARNLYALNETSLSWEALSELRPNERPWILSRSGFAGIHRYAAMWGGDTKSDFASLQTAVSMSASMGLSGVTQFGHDIGGFLGSPTPELFIRWLQFASYTPLFRNHASSLSAPREPWQFGEPYTSLARNTINERYRMLPHIYSIIALASLNGEPPLTPLMYHFAADQSTYAVNDEFMLGEHLLIAPVTIEGAVSRDVYFPAGCKWVDITSNQTYLGGQTVSFSVPLDKIPVFARAGSLLLRGPLKQHSTDPVNGPLEVDIFPGGSGVLTLYEDDGISLGYKNGLFLRTDLINDTAGTERTFTIRRIDGQWAPGPRIWRLNFKDATQPVIIERNGTLLPNAQSLATFESVSEAWFYNPTDRQLLVRVSDTSTAIQLVIR